MAARPAQTPLGQLLPTSPIYAGMHQLVTQGRHLFEAESASFFAVPGVAEAERTFPYLRAPVLPPPPLHIPAIPPIPPKAAARRVFVGQELHPRVPLFTPQQARHETFEPVQP